MRFFEIRCPDRFFSKVMQCRGNVYYVDKTGQKRDLKQLAGQLLPTAGMMSINGLTDIDVYTEDSLDSMRMLNFAIESNVW